MMLYLDKTRLTHYILLLFEKGVYGFDGAQRFTGCMPRCGHLVKRPQQITANTNYALAA